VIDVAVVTGGSRGIGRATAEALAKRGLSVAVLGRSLIDLEAVVGEIERGGGSAQAIECDVGDGSSINAAALRVLRELGAPRVVVNNAGVVERASVEETTEGMWDHVLDVNLKGPFLVTRAFLHAMRERARGRIVHVASISATLGTPRLSAYCASKWGVIGFMKSLAEELRGSGLQTMAVLPGSVDTAMLRGSGFAAQMSAEQVAATITYLSLDAPDAMNGSAVEVFGP
jgi:3-oxoacyl-[acyl-carrier protein] reductase